MKRAILLLLAVMATGAVWYAISLRNQPPEVSFAKARRERIVSVVATNGRVEPVEWAAVRAETSGAVEKINTEKGQRVAIGAVLVELNNSAARAELVQAEARVVQVKTELEMQARGGRAADLAEIAGSLQRARLERELAQRELESLERLEARKAATAQEVRVARDRLDRAEVDIQNLEARRAALVSSTDRQATEARLRDADAAVLLARTRMEMSLIRAPISGTVYQFDLKPGAFLNAGDLVAMIGKLDRVHVNLFVDEPDLGRVAAGMPVSISWDARPGARWTGTVERMPVEVKAMGTRQVGEVVCIIDNPGGELIPGTNVNAEIESQVVDNAITIPKEALRYVDGKTGVYVLNGDIVEWRHVHTGVGSVTRTQVEGLKEGDAVALPSDDNLSPGRKVRPRFP